MHAEKATPKASTGLKASQGKETRPFLPTQDHHHHHLPLNHEGRWGTTDDFATSFLHFFPVLHCPLGLGELQACPFPNVVFPPLPQSALSSFPLSLCLAIKMEHNAG